jgi:hypothetical protein
LKKGLLCKETRIRAGQPKLAEVPCESGHFSQQAVKKTKKIKQRGFSSPESENLISLPLKTRLG